MTNHKMIRLNFETAEEFVRTASGCDFDIDVANSSRQSYIVDAKSLLGVLGLDMRSPLKVSYNGYNEEFEKFLKSNAAVA